MIAQVRDLEQKVKDVAAKFPGEVLRIRYSVGEDWTGDPAVFFRVLLSDEASRHEVLGDITRRVTDEVFNDIKWADSDCYPYFEYRNQSEQDKLKDPNWE